MLPSALGPEIALYLPVNDLRPLYRALRCARMAQDGRGHLYPLARGQQEPIYGELKPVLLPPRPTLREPHPPLEEPHLCSQRSTP